MAFPGLMKPRVAFIGLQIDKVKKTEDLLCIGYTCPFWECLTRIYFSTIDHQKYDKLVNLLNNIQNTVSMILANQV